MIFGISPRPTINKGLPLFRINSDCLLIVHLKVGLKITVTKFIVLSDVCIQLDGQN